MLVNFTNHPSSQWGEGQLREAENYGDIVDIPFPAVDPEGDEAYISALAAEYEERILNLAPDAVLCQGEFCLVYQVVSLLKEKEITVLAACSERCVIQNGDRKEVTFSFRRFRRY